MNIAVISFYLPPFDRIGSGVQTHYLANAYARAGHTVTVFSPYCVGDCDALYELIQVPCGKVNRTLQFAVNLRKVDFSRFDLLHAGMDDWALLGVRRPYHIRTFHGSCFAEAMVATNMRAKVRMAWLGLTELISCAVADKTVAVSRNTIRFIPFCRDVVWNGVDKSLFHPGSAKSNNPSILFVGTFDSRKRGRVLLEQFVTTVRSHIPTAEMWVVRETTDPDIPGVTVFGSVSNEVLAELYRTAWVFCLPSSYEGFGVPYIEAMSSGTAILATPNLGALEVTDDGLYGRICNVTELGSSLIELLTDSDKRASFERLGLERTDDLDWDSLVQQYLKFVPVTQQ